MRSNRSDGLDKRGIIDCRPAIHRVVASANRERSRCSYVSRSLYFAACQQFKPFRAEGEAASHRFGEARVRDGWKRRYGFTAHRSVISRCPEISAAFSDL